MKNDNAKLKTEEKKRNVLKRSFLLFALFVLVIVSGLAITRSVFATHGPGPTPSDQSCTICPDNDKDGYRAYCDTSHVFDKSFSCGYPPPDCNDADPWSHSYGSKDIASVKVEYSPGYVAKTQTDKKFTPDSKKLNPTLGDFLVTATFKAKKCGMTAGTPALVPMKIFYTTKDSSGNELSFYLISATPDNRTIGYLAKVSDLVYQGLISTSQDPRFLPAIEPYIASVAANRPVALKFLGPDIGPNKDTPKYQPLPMTNCAQTYGSGRHKVVYMRSYDPGTSLQGYIALANTANRSFNVIEPFKKYQNEFSHYIDLKLQSLPGVSLALDIKQLKYDANMVRKSSSCGARGSAYVLFDKGDNSSPRASGLRNGVIIMDGEFIEEEEYAVDIGPILVHEAGHAFAGLMDEYVYDDPAPLFKDYLLKMAARGNNCTTDPSKYYSYGGFMYGLKLTPPVVNFCSLDDLSPDDPYRPLLNRPSYNSLMMGHDRKNENRFNVVSCGYILKTIKKGGTAKSYFPECAAMPGIIPVGE